MFFHEKITKNADLEKSYFLRERSKVPGPLFHSCRGCVEESHKKARDAPQSAVTKVAKISVYALPKLESLGPPLNRMWPTFLPKQ